VANFLPLGQRSVNVCGVNGSGDARHLSAYQRIRRGALVVSDIKRPAVKIAKPAACFGGDQTARCVGRLPLGFDISAEGLRYDLPNFRNCLATMLANGA